MSTDTDLTIDIGETVIHPHHGAVTIEKRQEREIGDEVIEMLVLTTEDDLAVMVPADQVEETGIRPCMPKKELEAVLDVLGEEPSPVKGHWSRRLKKNKERYRSGDPEQVAVVVRDLFAKDQAKKLSPAERRLYRDARRMIEGELAAVVKGGQEAAEKKVDKALACHVVVDEDEAKKAS